MNSNIISLLKVPGFWVKDIQITGEEIIVLVKKRSKTAKCPHCMKRTKRLKDYLPFTKVLHLMLCNQKVYLWFQKRRFTCCFCKKVFVEPIPFLPRYQRHSMYAKQHALERLSDSSFQATTKRLGISYGSLTSLLKRVFTLDAIQWDRQSVSGVVRLGIDEHHFGKKHKYLVTVANLLTGKPIHILPNANKNTLVSFLKTLPDNVKDSIDEVATDMRRSFVHAVKETLPKAKIVIDHFHVIQDANKRVTEARRIEQDVEEKVKRSYPKHINAKLLNRNREDLTGKQQELVTLYLNTFPAVEIFYKVKEELRNMYKSQTRDDADQKLTVLILFMKTSEYPELWIWAKTLTSYKEYILNYFDNHTTNATTEGLHRKFKLIQRQAYGFRNPEVYIRRILLACLPLPILIYPNI